MTRIKLEKRIQRLYKRGMGMVKIGKTLGIGTGAAGTSKAVEPFRRRPR